MSSKSGGGLTVKTGVAWVVVEMEVVVEVDESTSEDDMSVETED
jgi:hypothetical protein